MTPTWNEDLLDAAQRDAAGRIMGSARLREIAFFQERLGVQAGDIDAALTRGGQAQGPGGKLGLAMLLHQPRFQQPNANFPGPVGTLAMDIEVAELPDLNREPGVGTGITASECAANLITLFNRFNVGTGPNKSRAFRLPSSAVEPTSDGDGLVTLTVRIEFNAGFDRLSRVAPVTIGLSAGMITLTCATDDAEIYFTLDGSYPRPARTGESLTSMLYLASFAAPAGAWDLRAGAYLGVDLIDSDLSRARDTDFV